MRFAGVRAGKDWGRVQRGRDSDVRTGGHKTVLGTYSEAWGTQSVVK